MGDGWTVKSDVRGRASVETINGIPFRLDLSSMLVYDWGAIQSHVHSAIPVEGSPLLQGYANSVSVYVTRQGYGFMYMYGVYSEPRMD